MQHVVKVGRPPNFMDIVRVFPKAANASVIFAYDDTIFVSSEDVLLPPFLVAHECVHLKRQREIGVKVWWEKYLADPKFRYKEELMAHAAELSVALGSMPERKVARAKLTVTAKRLIAPLYRFENVTLEMAKSHLANQSGMLYAFV